MRTRSVTELHQAFLVRGGFQNSTVWSLTNFLELLNSAVAEIWKLLADTWEDYYLFESTATSTVAGTESYAVPADFWRLRMIEVSRNGTGETIQDYQRLERAGLEVLNRVRKLSGEPVIYHLRGVPGATNDPSVVPKIILAPTPTQARKIRITYIPTAPVFAEEGEVWDAIIGYDKLLLELCLMDAYKRSKMPINECAQEVARLTQSLISSAPNRDAGQPETIAQFVAPPSAAIDWEDVYT